MQGFHSLLNTISNLFHRYTDSIFHLESGTSCPWDLQALAVHINQFKFPLTLQHFLYAYDNPEHEAAPAAIEDCPQFGKKSKFTTQLWQPSVPQAIFVGLAEWSTNWSGPLLISMESHAMILFSLCLMNLSLGWMAWRLDEFFSSFLFIIDKKSFLVHWFIGMFMMMSLTQIQRCGQST